MEKNKIVFFIGMKHCGKSTHALIFAKKINAEFIDLDFLIEELYEKNNSKSLSCREIYREYGKEEFMKYEAMAIDEIFVRKFQGIVALGGGIASNALALEKIEGKGLFVYIDVEADILFQRIEERGLPPFLQTENPYQSFLDLYKERTLVYSRLADLIISPVDTDISRVSELIYTELKRLI